MRCTWVDFMEFDIVEEKDNIFFKRKELKLRLKHPNASTPSKQELIKGIAEKYKAEEDCIVVDYIFTKKGLGESEAKVKIYEEKPKLKEKKGEKPIEKAEEVKTKRRKRRKT